MHEEFLTLTYYTKNFRFVTKRYEKMYSKFFICCVLGRVLVDALSLIVTVEEEIGVF